MLIIHALSGSRAGLKNLSRSDDTHVMQQALNDPGALKDVGHAGTTMRFLTAYYSTLNGEVTLTGSSRMKERPIGPLVEALRDLGAQIAYEGVEGNPPLLIRGKPLHGGSIQVDGSISSQFISALMMIGPQMEGGLTMELTGQVVSETYIRMTLELMNRCGASAGFDGRTIRIPQTGYRMEEMAVESDWSGASYWFLVAALLPGSVIRMPFLHENSLQGDSALVEIFTSLGVNSRFEGEELIIQSGSKVLLERFEYDFIGCPDLVQTCAAALCAMGIPFRFNGTRTLRVKETDRIMALQNELAKFGFILESDSAGEWIAWNGNKEKPVKEPVVSTYHDHRMAMAFAPLAIPFGKLVIDDPGVVSKSYPGYWDDLAKAGFQINEPQ